MRRWGNVAIPCIVLVVSSPALAQPAEDVAATSEGVAAPPTSSPPVGYGAMPGGLHVPSAEILPAGTVEIAARTGYGYRKGLLSADHKLTRAVADLAFAFAPLPYLMVGLSLDGRYDQHSGFRMVGDDNYVGDPHVMLRYGRALGRVTLGGQLGVWLPGKDAPSVAASAISFDARALATIDAGVGVLSLDAGFRIDNSKKSVDNVASYTLEDRVSLGVSDFHAALAGVSFRIPAGKRAFVSLEGSADLFVGSNAPGSILRGGALAGVSVTDAIAIVGFIELARVPSPRAGVAMTPPVLVQLPYEPLVTGGIGLQGRFGGKSVVKGQITENKEPEPVIVIETADVTGVVVDDVGRPVIGARIAVKLKKHTGTAVTKGEGTYTIAGLPIGRTVDGKTELDDTGAEISVEVENKKPGSATLTLVKGPNAVPRIALDPLLPPGQLRAVIINVGNSRPVAGATVTIEPGGITATSGPDGKFTVDLPPGRYKLTVTARGLAQQQLDVNIDPNGVAIKNIDMHK
jgi:hypothetical protein